MNGWALAEQGRLSEGVEQMRRTLDAYSRIGSEISRPHFLALLAEALAKSGEPTQALLAVAEALALAEATGQRYYEAELHRLKGEIMLARGDTHEAESSFNRSVEVARRQRARSFELRARVSLSRLWQHQNRRNEARQHLAVIYSSFTEGFDTPDLKEASGLLGEMSSQLP